MAPLSTNTKLQLQGPTLIGYHKDGKPLAGTIDLNQYIGNVDGRLTWGGSDFYIDAQQVKINGTLLSADLKNSVGRYVKTTLDIDQLFQNRNGAFEAVSLDHKNVGSTPGDVPTAEAMSKFSGSGHSVDSMVSSKHSASTQNSSSTSVTTSSAKHKVKTESHKFSYDTSAIYKLLQDNCRSSRLDDKIFHAECRSDDDAFKATTFNLESYIHESARNFRLEKLTIVFEVWNESKWIPVSVDLNLHLRIYNSSLVVYIPFPNFGVSEMFSTVPWLNFQVVAKPDLAKLAGSALAQEVMSTVATTIVEDSIRTMKHIINTTVEQALEEVTRTAVSKLSVMVQTMIQAQASTELPMSSTDLALLHVMAQKQMMNGLGMT